MLCVSSKAQHIIVQSCDTNSLNMEQQSAFCDYCDYVFDDSCPRNRSSFESHGHIVYSCDVCHLQNDDDDNELVRELFVI
jgi:Zn-finger protein